MRCLVSDTARMSHAHPSSSGSASAPQSARIRDFRGRRWAVVALRSLHLVGVVLIGCALLTADTSDHRVAAALTLVSGLAMYGLEVWSKPRHAVELAGLFIPLKLCGVTAMIALPQSAALLFWVLLVTSSIVSHAPGSFRHIRMLRRERRRSVA